ncbi:uncharacterized protein TEOVI_000716800 [Trypanosoma equiperdum]|uniref:Uncharacterized protein n=2 Tax=Trypanozoon TaxID=39700 RepID=Q382I3_TRYB2|nr:hypothetical protein, conserved [Trypanosoma brucei brucei TREU927]EAN80298.1 hypothetical protein, conserved [Trypanosoma brucei brucei TREU927]SCU66281.1 hypothetical protein, conserved [Trypanosoma equiperdum]
MFSRTEVDALFNEALRVSQRSLLLLNERSRGPPPPQQQHLQSSSTVGSSGFATTVQELRNLADFSAFVDAAGDVCQRIQKESRQPSSTMQRRRQNGATYPLLSRVVEGLVGVRRVWNGGVEELWSSGAALTLLLLRAALFADWVHGMAKAEEIRTTLCGVTENASAFPLREQLRREVDPLLLLLRKVREGMPEEFVDQFDAEVIRVMCRLPMSVNAGREHAIAPLYSLLLFPGLIPYVALNAAHPLAAMNVVAPIESIATGLLQVYLRESAVEFSRACSTLVRHAVLVGACVEQGATLVGEIQKGVCFMKQLFDALLVSVERAFSAAAAPRAGMTEVFCSAFAGPFRALVQMWVSTGRDASPVVPANELRTLSHVWCTASYRALIVVESLGHAELGVLSGCGSATSQQKRYNAMLQQSRGKITTAILSAVTEDRLLLFEETAARSGHGHKVFRICDAGVAPASGSGNPCVFVYIDNGTVYMKVGRERTFRRANSVEEVFSIFTQ